MIIINRTNSSAFFVKFILIKVLFAENPSWLFGGRCEEKWEEDGRVCQLGNFWNRFQNSDFFAVFPRRKVFEISDFFRGFPRFLGDPKILKMRTFPQCLGISKDGLVQIFSELGLPCSFLGILKGRTQTYLRFSWDFIGMDPPAKSSHWTTNPGNREVWKALTNCFSSLPLHPLETSVF